MSSQHSERPVLDVAAVFAAEEKTPENLALVLDLLKMLQTEDVELKETAEVCADASREDNCYELVVGWRTPLGESQILAFFQSILSSAHKDNELGRHALRLIGNCCADNDANRQRVLDHPVSLTPVIKSTKNPALQKVGSVVLHNICLDYEPSQLKAISDGACSVILEVIGREGFLEDGEELDYFTRILETLLSHDAGKESCPPSALQVFLSLTASPNCTFYDHLSLFTLFSSLLSTSTFQTILIGSNLFPQTLHLLEKSFTFSISDPGKQDVKLISYARNALIENIGDVSSQENFLTTYPLSSPLMTRVRGWLSETDDAKVDLVVTACLVHGNVGRSDEVCGSLTREYEVHKELLGIIRRTVKNYNDAVKAARLKGENPIPLPEGEKLAAGQGAVGVGVLHAATGVLKNLAIANGNKEVLGRAGALDVIQEMINMEGVGVGQVWYSAVGFGRLVCVNCPENVALLLQSSPEKDQTLLSRFLHVYTTAKELPTKTEIARTIAAVLRVLYTSPAFTLDSPELETELYMHEIARPLWDMIVQDKWPVVRSEGIFALALMARGAAENVWRECSEGEEKVLRGLEAKDLDNAIILMAEIKKRLGEGAEDRVHELLAAVLEKRGKGLIKE